MATWLLIFAPDVILATGEEYYQVPLLDGGDMIQVPVQAFQKTLYFIVDTGFTISALDARYKPYLGNQIGSYSAISPLATKKCAFILRQPIHNQSMERWRHYDSHLRPLKEMLQLAGIIPA